MEANVCHLPPPRSWTVDMQQFLENRGHFPPNELAKYAGRYVAWSADGTRIVGSDEDELRLDATVRAAGYDPSDLLVSFVAPGDDVLLGAPEIRE
jgi:hypothetical protein